MIRPATPADEPDRLAQLHELEVLDTVAEPAWDRIAALAAYICDVPVALVSFVDHDRQWFKARVGLTVSETPRDASFCAHAILRDEILYVPNARRDRRFAQNPLVRGAPQIRAYAGAPVKGPRGAALGTVCVIDTRPRRLADHQLEALRWLADQAEELFRYRDAGQRALRLLEDPAFAGVDNVAQIALGNIAKDLAPVAHPS